MPMSVCQQLNTPDQTTFGKNKLSVLALVCVFSVCELLSWTF